MEPLYSGNNYYLMLLVVKVFWQSFVVVSSVWGALLSKTFLIQNHKLEIANWYRGL